jgi:hypothetical protein
MPPRGGGSASQPPPRSTSIPSAAPSRHSARDWLEAAVYDKKRRRTSDLVRLTIETITMGKEGMRVSLTTIATVSKEIDPESRGVSESAILNNPAAHALWVAARTAPAKRIVRRAVAPPDAAPADPRIKVDRDPERARRRYRGLTKEGLIDRLLAVEAAYATREDRWQRAGDDVLEWRLRAEAAEARLRKLGLLDDTAA